MAGTNSTWTPVISGIPQGSVLGPVLFMYDINDKPDSILSLIYIYADDTKQIKRINHDEDEFALQSDLNRVWYTYRKCSY